MNKEVQARLQKMFKTQISTEDFAQEMRVFLDAVLSMGFEMKDLDLYQPELREGYFYLTMLCEHLDPVLGKYEE